MMQTQTWKVVSIKQVQHDARESVTEVCLERSGQSIYVPVNCTINLILGKSYSFEIKEIQ